MAFVSDDGLVIITLGELLDHDFSKSDMRIDPAKLKAVLAARRAAREADDGGQRPDGQDAADDATDLTDILEAG